MSHLWSRITFAIVALSLLYGGHRYAWARFGRDVQLSRAWKIGAAIVIALLGISIPAAFFLSRRSIGEGEVNLALVAYVWLGFLFYCVLLLGALDLARVAAGGVKRLRRLASSRRSSDPSGHRASDHSGDAARATQLDSRNHSDIAIPHSSESSASTDSLARSAASAESVAQRDRDLVGARSAQESPANPDRRVFLARVIAGSAALGSGAIAIHGYHAATGDITTPEIPVHLARLPRELSGYRIVQISDLHLGPTLASRFLESVVEKANAQKPDLVAITGDMVDGRVATLAPALAPLAKLSARHGVVFVTGNHEYYAGAEEWVEFLRKQGIRVLMNERIEIGDTVTSSAMSGGDEIWRAATAIGSRRAQRTSFDLAGIPDLHGGSYSPEHAPDLDRALDGRDPERELVLLAHQPAQIAMAENRGVGLQLSGHTHGGQMWPFGALVSLAQPYVAGFHRHRDGTQIYVSRGTGFWGPPLRVCNPAEVTSIVLVAG
jgi:predicted MPP superfamily phosphohydrolase